MPVLKIKFFTFILLIACSSCNTDEEEKEINHKQNLKKEIDFDQSKWQTKHDQDYPYRDLMLKSLMDNDSIRQLKRDAILNTLGEPDRIDSNYFFYRIVQRRIGLFPLHTKTMVINLKEDSTINWMKIHE